MISTFFLEKKIKKYLISTRCNVVQFNILVAHIQQIWIRNEWLNGHHHIVYFFIINSCNESHVYFSLTNHCVQAFICPDKRNIRLFICGKFIVIVQVAMANSSFLFHHTADGFLFKFFVTSFYLICITILTVNTISRVSDCCLTPNDTEYFSYLC